MGQLWWYFQFAIYSIKEMMFKIMQHMHNCRTAWDLGRDNTLIRMRTTFYWPGMSSDVQRWSKTCLLCQKRKPGTGVGKSPLQYVTNYGPMECVAINIMGPLPIIDNGNQYIMVVADYFSKWTAAYALTDHAAQSVSDKLITKFVSRSSTPIRIHIYQGSEL